ncbi:MAG: DUF192 domain-containing protein [bacterium]
MSKKIIKIMLISILFFLIISIASGVIWWYFARTKPINASVRIGDNVFAVEIADTMTRRSAGLSERTSIGARDGMLFIFSNPSIQRFWMRGMKFSIDIIWIRDGHIIGIEKAIPAPKTVIESMNTYTSPEKVSEVLEVSGGTADVLGINVGDAISIIR